MKRETGKSRAERIKLDYHKYRGWLYWSRWWAAIVAVAISGLYGFFVLFGVFGGGDGTQQLSPLAASAVSQVNTGPLSKAHAHLSNCNSCHSAPFGTAIAQDAFKLDEKASSSVQQVTCTSCHSASSHFHSKLNSHAQLIDQNCAGCHLEHQGSLVDLRAVENQACVQCHSKLETFCSGSSSVLTNISSFLETSHSVLSPDGKNTFRSLGIDTGRVKFDHAQHLIPGQVELGRKGGFRRDMLNPQWQQIYTQEQDGLVVLNCSSCHEEHKLDARQTSFADSETSHYYAPVDYEKHCAACHQLTFVGQSSEMLPLPHAAPRAEIATILSSKLLGGKISGTIRMTGDGTVAFEPPGGATLPSVVPNEKQTFELKGDTLQTAVNDVFVRCSQCHQTADVTDEAILQRLAGKSQPLIPQRWLNYGLFDHAAHRNITNCEFCHEVPQRTSTSADAADLRAEDHKLVMIKGPESCVPCHRESSTKPALDLSTEAARQEKLGVGKQSDIASADCRLCHRYHFDRPADSKTSGQSVASIANDEAKQ